MYPAPAPTSLKVFVVENSLPVRERLVEMLASIHGVEAVGTASRADDAIEMILDLLPHAVILDIHLAKGSGIDVLRAVVPAAPRVEFWINSSYADEGYRTACRRLGAARFFDKSSDFERMRECIVARATQRQVH